MKNHLLWIALLLPLAQPSLCFAGSSLHADFVCGYARTAGMLEGSATALLYGFGTAEEAVVDPVAGILASPLLLSHNLRDIDEDYWKFKATRYAAMKTEIRTRAVYRHALSSLGCESDQMSKGDLPQDPGSSQKDTASAARQAQ